MAYAGEKVAVRPLLDDLRRAAEKERFRVEIFGEVGGFPIYGFSRQGPSGARSVYLSAGIHGDEPAGPLAILELLRTGLPHDISWTICPALNPVGLQKGTRENSAGADLNRDYHSPKQPETQAHVRWLNRQRNFDLALFLHEDWETSGFYLYEVNPTKKGFSLARTMLDAVERHCPIEQARTIDGHEALGGLIVPNADDFQRENWPEAFYMLMHHNQLNYTIEAPSALPMPVRVAALAAAVRGATSAFISGQLQG